MAPKMSLEHAHDMMVVAVNKRDKVKLVELLKEYPQTANYPSGVV